MSPICSVRFSEVGGVKKSTGSRTTQLGMRPKYRNPASGETRSGRGRMPAWLKNKQDAGEEITKFRGREAFHDLPGGKRRGWGGTNDEA
jgi:hypothetical protein